MEQIMYQMLNLQFVVSNKIKSVSGDSSSLSPGFCGTTSVRNFTRTVSFYKVFQV